MREGRVLACRGGIPIRGRGNSPSFINLGSSSVACISIIPSLKINSPY